MRIPKLQKRIILLFLVLTLAGCFVIADIQLENMFGPAKVQQRVVPTTPKGPNYYTEVKPILENRCVVCHACYDAPCQLKLSSIEGIDRGASKKLVYLGERLLAIPPSRLYLDSKDTVGWREKGFHPILNERIQNPQTNLSLSPLYRLLDLKRRNPSRTQGILPDSFDLSLDRDQQCPSVAELDKFEQEHPLWGMPYGLPGLSTKEFETIRDWIKHGAKVKKRAKLKPILNSEIKRWEKFFNGRTIKEKLVNRYIYEHLFLAHLYFKDVSSSQFFRIVRSKTPPGEEIEIIPTRRPFDDPKTKVFYYRLWPERSTITNKTHMPYALSSKRMKRWKDLFYSKNYSVSTLPSYEPKLAANPFATFSAIPLQSRYEFMLDEAEFTIMGFIKGPVCRGNIALNVIEDRFWVMFVDPKEHNQSGLDEFLAEQYKYLRLPAAESSNTGILPTFLKYSYNQTQYLEAKAKFMEKIGATQGGISVDRLWDGGKENTNAALTIFRHADAASVVKGFVGKPPQTAWLIGYPLLERIHYLLVAGFDLFGNVGHQFNSRIYMEFLRREGEANFLELLPEDVQEFERKRWYHETKELINEKVDLSKIRLQPNLELLDKSLKSKSKVFSDIKDHLGTALSKRYARQPSSNDGASRIGKILGELENASGDYVQYLNQLSFVRVKTDSKTHAYTIIRDTAYADVATPFFQSLLRKVEDDRLVVTKELLGAYPNVFFDVKESQLESFVKTISSLNSEESYRRLIDKFGIRRTNPDFWNYLDWAHQTHRKEAGVEAGLFDLNRYENR